MSGTVSTDAVTHAERIGPGREEARRQRHDRERGGEADARDGRVVAGATSTMNATMPTTTNAPAAAPSTWAKPGRGRRCARQPSRETSAATTSPVMVDQAVGGVVPPPFLPPRLPGSSPDSLTFM